MADVKDLKKNIVEDVKEITEEAIDELEDVIKKKSKKSHKQAKSKKTTLIMVAITVLLFLLCIILLVISFTIKTDATRTAYINTKTEFENAAYEEMGKTLYNLGEQRYHTSNKIGISIDGIKKVYSLETLEVTEIDYYIHSGDKDIKSEAWYKIIGTGVFTINMSLAEIIVDEERNYILIRVPEPTINSDDFNVTVQEFHFEANIFEGVASGEGIAEKAEKEGYKNIKAKILSNQDYFNCAKNSAESQLIDLAKKCNPNLDVEVAVEFF